ncbi:MAG: hypothetical protein U1E65_24635 [Myxococcota bacterium]
MLRYIFGFLLALGLASTETLARAEPPPPALVFIDQGSAGIAAGLLAVPLAAGIGSAYGAGPSNLVIAALPPLLLFLLGPPLCVVLAETLYAEHKDGVSGRFWPAFLATTGVQLGVLIVAVLAGVDAKNTPDLVALSAVDTLLLAGTSSAMLMLTRPGPEVALDARPPLGGGAVVWRF